MLELAQILKDYDLPTIIIIVVIYYSLNKKVSIVDRASNDSSMNTFDCSKELNTLSRNVDKLTVEVVHVKKEVDAHRRIDEKTFEVMAKDITAINDRLYFNR